MYQQLSPEPEAALEETATPGIKTIDALAQFLGVPAEKTIKAVFYAADGEVVFVSIRGDLEINDVKLKNVLHAKELRLADDEEVREAGLVAGSASAVGLTRACARSPTGPSPRATTSSWGPTGPTCT